MKVLFRLILAFFALGLAAVTALGIYVYSLFPQLPEIESINDVKLKVPLRIYSVDGDLIAEYGDERRFPISIDAIPPSLKDAILSAEDDSFYEHPGIDIPGIVRAAIANLRSGEHGQGASTITMQVARNYFLTREKTYTRKLKEILLAFRLEQVLAKDQILELYVNKIFLGHRAYGFAAAALVYYGKTLQELNLPQVAMLAGLPKAPSTTNPITNPERAKERRDYVLNRMLELDKISRDAHQFAVEAEITAEKHITKLELDAPHIAEMARQHMLDQYGDKAYTDGYRVFTTIKSDLQKAADKALRAGLQAYDRRHGFRGPVKHLTLNPPEIPQRAEQLLLDLPSSREIIPAVVSEVSNKAARVVNRDGESLELSWPGIEWARAHVSARRVGPKPKTAADILKVGDFVYIQPDPESGEWRLSQLPEVSGALVSLNPNDGRIIALCGGFDYYLSKFNRATQAERQPGSNIKPFIYSAALDKGFTAATLVSGAPIVVEDKSLNDIWRPENYSGKFFGPTRIRKALTLSLNLVSIRLLRAISPEYALAHLQKFGLDQEKLPSGLSLALGAASLTPLEVVQAYAVFANGGYRVRPYFISRIEDRDGITIEETEPHEVCTTCLPGETFGNLDHSGESTVLPDSGRKLAPRVLSAENAFIMTSLMRQVVKSGTGRKALKLGRKDLAGKTGTTNNFRDAWFSGFNPDVVTSVWVGFDQPADLGRAESGAKAALPIWIDYMAVALEGRPEKPLLHPDSVISTFVHKETGEAVLPSHPQAYQEYFVAGTNPKANFSERPAYLKRPQESTSGSVTEGLF